MIELKERKNNKYKLIFFYVIIISVIAFTNILSEIIKKETIKIDEYKITNRVEDSFAKEKLIGEIEEIIIREDKYEDITNIFYEDGILRIKFMDENIDYEKDVIPLINKIEDESGIIFLSYSKDSSELTMRF